MPAGAPGARSASDASRPATSVLSASIRPAANTSVFAAPTRAATSVAESAISSAAQLVRDRYVRAHEAVAGHAPHHLVEPVRLDAEQLVGPVQADRLESGVLHRRRAAVAHRPAEQSYAHALCRRRRRPHSPRERRCSLWGTHPPPPTAQSRSSCWACRRRFPARSLPGGVVLGLVRLELLEGASRTRAGRRCRASPRNRGNRRSPAARPHAARRGPGCRSASAAARRGCACCTASRR